MFTHLLIKEIHLNLLNIRFKVASALILFVFITGSILSTRSTLVNQKLYDEYTLKWTEDIRNQAESSISSVAVRSRDFLMGPRSNVYISDCQERFIPNVIRYNAFNVHRFEVRPFIANPLLNRNEEVNWSFIMIFIISLVALLLSFDAISGEREAKTLILCLSNSVSRSHIFLAKWLSIVIVLVITLFISVVLSLLIQILGGTIIFNIPAILEVLLFFGIASILSGLMACLGLLCSVLCSRSNVSLLCAISLWLIFALIIPNTSILWADKLYPIESFFEVNQKVDARNSQIIDSYPPEKWHADFNRPFTPEHKIRSEMNMEMLISEKQIFDDHFRSMFSQFERARRITGISPLSLLHQSMEEITGGGYLRFQKNWESLGIYQQQLLEYFKDADARDNESPHWLNPFEELSSSKKPVKFEEIPLYTEQWPGFAERFSGTARYGGILLIYTSLIFVFSIWIFNRYDVR